MTAIAEKREPLPPIDLSSIIFEDEEDDEYDTSHSTSPATNPISSSLATSSSTIPSSAFLKREPLPPIDLSSIIFEDEEDDEYDISSNPSPISPDSSPIPSSSTITSSPPGNTTTTKPSTSSRKVLEPTDHSTDFLWPMGIRPLELRAPPDLIQNQAFVPNNNGIDEILNGPRGQVAPATRPPDTSPKWNWEPRLTRMRQVSTIHHHPLEPNDCASSFLWPLGIRPLKVGGHSHRALEEMQAVAVAVAPDNNNNNDLDDEIIMNGGPGGKMMAPSPKYDWGPSSMKMMMRRHAWKMSDEIVVLPSPPPSPAPAAVQLGNGVLFGAIGVLGLVGLLFLE